MLSLNLFNVRMSVSICQFSNRSIDINETRFRLGTVASFGSVGP